MARRPRGSWHNRNVYRLFTCSHMSTLTLDGKKGFYDSGTFLYVFPLRCNVSTSLGPMCNFPPRRKKRPLSQHIFIKGSVPIHTLQAPHTVVSSSVAHKAALRDLYRSKVGQPHVFTSSTFCSMPEQLHPPCLPWQGRQSTTLRSSAESRRDVMVCCHIELNSHTDTHFDTYIVCL